MDTIPPNESWEGRVLRDFKTHIAASEQAHLPSGTAIRVVTDPRELAAIPRKPASDAWIPQFERLMLKDAKALKIVETALNSSERAMQYNALYDLNYFWGIPKGFIPASFRAPVYALLDQAETRKYAIEALPTVDPENAHQKLAQLLRSDALSYDLQIDAINSLGDCPVDDSSIALLEQLLRHQESLTTYQASNLIANMLRVLVRMDKKATPAQNKRIARVVLPFVLESKINERSIPSLLEIIVREPEPEWLPLLEAKRNDEDCLRPCLEGIAKLKGNAAQPLVLQYLRQPATTWSTFRAIQYAWKDDPKGALQMYIEAYNTVAEKHRRDHLLALVWKTGGAEMCTAFLQGLPESDSKKELQNAFLMLYLPMQPDHPLRKRADDLLRLGIIPQAIPPSELEQIQANNRRMGLATFEFELLDLISQRVHFDAHSDVDPIPYDELIPRHFVVPAQGKLDGLEVQMHWDASDNHPGQRVWVIFKGRAYTFKPREMDAWYDVDVIERVMNQVAADAGYPERFVRYETGDQTAGYFWGTPAFAKEAIKVIGLEK